VEVWVSIVELVDGEVDVEILDAPPSAAFYGGVVEAVAEGPVAIVRHRVRVGYVNGGDSSEIYRRDFAGVV
jgi:hypothetical protein